MTRVLELSERELAANTSDDASWHYDYRDTAYIYIGNLPPLLNLDILRVFSQWGLPTHLHVVRDEDGRSRGFGYLKYADPRSCALAVDNASGVKIQGRALRVDHTYFKLKRNQREDDFKIDYSGVVAEVQAARKAVEPRRKREKREKREKRPKLLEYKGGSDNLKDHLNDPMAGLDDLKDPMGGGEDLKDPMAGLDDLKDPMAGLDDLSDPMAQFEKK